MFLHALAKRKGANYPKVLKKSQIKVSAKIFKKSIQGSIEEQFVYSYTSLTSAASCFSYKIQVKYDTLAPAKL